MQIQLKFLRQVTTVFIVGTVIHGNTASSQSMPGLPENQLVLPQKNYTIPFHWQGDSINSKWEPHTALLVPVKLPNCPKQFFMQFDLGSPYSLLYKNKLRAIQSKYPKAMQLNDSVGKLLQFHFKAGNMPVVAKEILVKQFDSTAVNWSHNSVEIIGTIGADFIDNKVLVIDYPQQRLTISESVPGKLLPKLVLNDFMYVARRVLLPATIQGKRAMLYFDTGSSMYELLTNKQTCEALAIPNSEVTRSKVESWGKYLTANSLPSNDSIQIGNTSVRLHYSTYIEGVSTSQAEQMMKMGIGGMTGNKIFLGYKLVLDTRNKKFGLLF